MNCCRVGTIYYMSPEVISDQEYSFPSDIYSFSVTIWEMVHRKSPAEIKDLDNTTVTSEDSLSILLNRGRDNDPDKRPDLSEFIDFAQINLEESDTSQILCASGEQTKVMILGGLLRGDYTDSIYIFNSKQNKWNDLHLKLPRKLAAHGSVMINGEIYIFGGNDDEEYFKELYKLGENMEWIQLADMNEKRSGIGKCSIAFEDEIWVFGGGNERKERLKSVEKYNPKSNNWTVMPEMKEIRTCSAVSIINGKFYVSGGYNGWNTLKTIEVFDPEGEEWEIFYEMPFGLSCHASIVDGTNLIIIGGEIKNQFKFESSDEVWKINVLDPAKKPIKMANLNKKRCRHSAVKLSDGLMVIGGEIDLKQELDSVEIFDGRKWTERVIKDPERRSEFSYISLTTKNEELFLQQNDDLLKRCDQKLIAEGSIMILGGCSGYLNDLIYIYNLKENEWNKVYLKLPSNLSYHGSVMINGEIYIFGGYDGQEYFKEIYKLGENLEWVKLADMNEKRVDIGNSSVVFEDEIWVFGGENENWLKSVEKYNSKTDTWTMMSEMNNVRSSSAVSIINGNFMFLVDMMKEIILLNYWTQ